MKAIETEDRIKIVKLVKKGISTVDIMAIFHGVYRRQQIAAVRAWVTMGKKNQNKKIISISDSDKNIIISMINNGEATEAIHATFKNKYSTQQIAAIRAWVTMGKY